MTLTHRSPGPSHRCPTAFSRLRDQLRPLRHAGLRLVAVAVLVSGCSGASPAPPQEQQLKKPGRAEDLLIVDCLLPGQIRRLGTQATIVMPRRPAKIPARECEIRGGEYVAFDRASYDTSLKMWLPMANEGDALAQTYVGEIYEKGLGVKPDYAEAARWYRRAAEGGNARAAANLGYLYEQGLGVNKDPAEAVAWYRRATGSAKAPFAVERVTVPATGAVPPARAGKTAPPAASPKAGVPPASGVPPPTIQITEPELTLRNGDISEIRVQPPIDRLTVAGRVSTPGGLKSVTIDGAETRVDAEQQFRTQIVLRSPEHVVTIAALDRAGHTTATRFVVRSRAATTDRSGELGGSYHALVVGNEDYRVLPRLATAVTDARLVAQTLGQEYGFKVVVLTNASRYDILIAFNDLRQRLTDKDNLLIYYAGHANRDADGQQGAWLLVDSEPANAGTWIPHAAITEFLSAMSVRQVLLATDSCYASGASRSASVAPDWDDERARQLLIETLSKRRSRMLMTSGTCDDSPASPGQPTLFTRSLVEILDANRDVLAGQEVFRLVQLRMAAGDRPDTTRTLRYSAIRYAGHEAGDFFFVRPRP
jgi:Caspase domain/Sel1 repeat